MSRFTEMFGRLCRPQSARDQSTMHSAILGAATRISGGSDHADLIDTDADRMMRLGREVWGLALIKLH